MIRLATPEDTRTICEIVNDGARAYKGVIPQDRYHEPYMPLEELESEIAARVVFWVEEGEEGAITGVMGIQDVLDVTLIRHAYVRTADQRRGVGARLLRHLLESTGRPVLIGTWKAAVWAIAFYERHGFELVPEAEVPALLSRYWSIPDRQIETSVVLRQSGEGAA